jgi:transcriptional regulator with XRE-family HTH domain
MKSTNCDRYLREQLQDPECAARFEQAGDAWEVALQIAVLRQQAGLSQKKLARRLKTSQQQVSRLESPNLEGHSLSTLRRIADILNADVRIVFESRKPTKAARAPRAANRRAAKRAGR